MGRPEMSSREKADHTEHVCLIILSKQKDHSKAANKIKDKILILSNKLDKIQKAFEEKKEEICEEENISYKFVTSILSGRKSAKEEELEEDLVDEII